MAERRISTVVVLVLTFGTSVLRAQRSCAGLQSPGTPTVSITLAAEVESGSFTPAESTAALTHLPGFCRITATLKPTSDSEIHSETWLPTTHWNGKLLAVGSGGWGGSIDYSEMAEGLRRGYVTTATDDGHTGMSASFVVGHPQKFVDFATARNMK